MPEKHPFTHRREWLVETRGAFARALSAELDHAYAKHGSAPWRRHEFYAILLEEVDELWDAIKRDEPDAAVLGEALQVAAMVLRFVETTDGLADMLCDGGPTRSHATITGSDANAEGV